MPLRTTTATRVDISVCRGDAKRHQSLHTVGEGPPCSYCEMLHARMPRPCIVSSVSLTTHSAGQCEPSRRLKSQLQNLATAFPTDGLVVLGDWNMISNKLSSFAPEGRVIHSRVEGTAVQKDRPYSGGEVGGDEPKRPGMKHGLACRTTCPSLSLNNIKWNF